jgi:RimJ/RimL family protein N-acetyltransferase
MSIQGAVPSLHPPNPALSDGVVSLRAWRREDVPAVVAACNDPTIATFLDRVPQPYTEADAGDWLDLVERGWADGTAAGLAIEVDGHAVGSIAVGFKDPDQGVAEVGYWMAAETRGRGLATRALRLASAWVLGELGIERLELRADVDNLASQRVAEKAGFTREGVLRAQRYNPRRGRRIDFVMYSLLHGEI